MRDGDPPFYGQPHRHHRSRRDEEHILVALDVFNSLVKEIEDIMGLIVRTIAGISITNITDEVIVFPIEFSGVDTVVLRVQATPETQVGERYVVRVVMDRELGDIVLPLDSVIFTQDDVDGHVVTSIPFSLQGIDPNGVSGFIAEVFLDAAVADIEVGVANGSLSGGLPPTDIVMNVGSGDLAGFDIELTIEDAAVAKFIGAVFPPSFELAATVPDPVDGPVVRVRGVDLPPDDINAGELTVLATLDIEPLAVGTSTITARIVALDNEAGFPIQVVINNGSIVVTA